MFNRLVTTLLHDDPESPLIAIFRDDDPESPLERFRAEGAAVFGEGRSVYTSIRPRSLKVLRAIDTLTRTHGQPPSLREIMQACGYKSPGSVAYQIDLLVARDFVTQRPHHARSLRLTPHGIALLATLNRQWQLATADYRAMLAGKT